MWVRCPDCPVRTKPLFRQFTAAELDFVTTAKHGQFDLKPRDAISDAGTGQRVFSLLAGWAFRFKSLPNGARQIVDFLLPGDLIGLHAPMIGRLKQGVIALTPVTVCEIGRDPVKRIFDEQPALASALMDTLLLDDDRADRRLLMLGRQRPTQRLAYLLLDLFERLEARESILGDSCKMPLSYLHLSDALGLSRAQLARSLAELKERGWARLRDGELTISDRDAMAAFAVYEGPGVEQKRALL